MNTSVVHTFSTHKVIQIRHSNNPIIHLKFASKFIGFASILIGFVKISCLGHIYSNVLLSLIRRTCASVSVSDPDSEFGSGARD